MEVKGVRSLSFNHHYIFFAVFSFAPFFFPRYCGSTAELLVIKDRTRFLTDGQKRGTPELPVGWVPHRHEEETRKVVLEWQSVVLGRRL